MSDFGWFIPSLCSNAVIVILLMNELNLSLAGADEIERRRWMRSHRTALFGRRVDRQFGFREVVIDDVLFVVNDVFVIHVVVFRVEAD